MHKVIKQLKKKLKQKEHALPRATVEAATITNAIIKIYIDSIVGR